MWISFCTVSGGGSAWCQVFSSFSAGGSLSAVFRSSLTSSYPDFWGFEGFSLRRTTAVSTKLSSAPHTNTAIRPRNLHTDTPFIMTQRCLLSKFSSSSSWMNGSFHCRISLRMSCNQLSLLSSVWQISDCDISHKVTLTSVWTCPGCSRDRKSSVHTSCPTGCRWCRWHSRTTPDQARTLQHRTTAVWGAQLRQVEMMKVDYISHVSMWT